MARATPDQTARQLGRQTAPDLTVTPAARRDTLLAVLALLGSQKGDDTAGRAAADPATAKVVCALGDIAGQEATG